MKDRRDGLIFALIILCIVYILINLVHFSWYYVNAEGFWSFNYFLGILGATITIAIIVVISFVFSFVGIISLLSDFPKNLNIKNALKALGFFLFFIVIMIINHLQVSGFSLYFNKKMADKYSYIEKSDEYINNGEYKKALFYSKKAYEKERKRTAINSFFFISKIYSKTQSAIKKKLEDKYAATINYAYCLQEINVDLKESESKYFEAVNISELMPYAEKENYKVFPFLSLAMIYLGQGKYAEAEDYFIKLISLASKYHKDDVEYVLTAKEIFAIYADRIGDISKSTRLREDNLKLYEISDLSKKSKSYLAILISTAYSEMLAGRMKEAGRNIAKAETLTKKRKKKEIYLDFLTVKGLYCYTSAIYGNGNETVLNNGILASIKNLLYKDNGLNAKFAREAETCFQELIEKSKSKDGKDGMLYIQSSHLLAQFYASQSRYKDSEKIYQEIFKTLEPQKNNLKDVYNSIFLNFLVVTLYNNNSSNIIEGLNYVENNLFKKLTANYSFLTEDEKEVYVSKLDKDINLINTLYIKSAKPGYTGRLYNNIIATKNVALYSNQYIREVINNSLDSTSKSNYYRLLKQKEDFERQYLNSNTISPLIESQKNALQLKEQEIIRAVQGNLKYKAFNPRDVTWTDIQKSLKENEAAIEFINIPQNVFSKDTIKYYALIVKKNSGYPELVPLFLETELYKILNKGGDTKQRIDSVYLTNKETLYSLVWKPLERNLSGISKVYISISGQLHKVSLPAILYDKKIGIELLGSTKDILLKEEKSIKEYSAVLFGNINYDFRKHDGGNKSSKREGVSPLRFSNDEILNIQRLFKQKGYHSEMFTDTIATKSAFLKLQDKKFNLLHMATHANYYPTNSLQTDNFLVNNELVGNMSSLYRSEILLAGANTNSELGISKNGKVTAMEISKLDLSRLDLVLLSACNSGLGDIYGSEGVYGLERAFKMAGVKSTIVSLWSVDDKATSELMTEFYKNLLIGYTKSKSLEIAQGEIRKKYSSPYYWAGFVLISN